jgi:hypothetical protein
VNVVVLHGIRGFLLFLFRLVFVAKVKRFVSKRVVRCARQGNKKRNTHASVIHRTRLARTRHASRVNEDVNVDENVNQTTPTLNLVSSSANHQSPARARLTARTRPRNAPERRMIFPRIHRARDSREPTLARRVRARDPIIREIHARAPSFARTRASRAHRRSRAHAPNTKSSAIYRCIRR